MYMVIKAELIDDKIKRLAGFEIIFETPDNFTT